jgi:hypothetical protein
LLELWSLRKYYSSYLDNRFASSYSDCIKLLFLKSVNFP